MVLRIITNVNICAVTCVRYGGREKLNVEAEDCNNPLLFLFQKRPTGDGLNGTHSILLTVDASVFLRRHRFGHLFFKYCYDKFTLIGGKEMIDIERAIKAFEEYVNAYDQMDGKVNLKKAHTYGVVEFSEYIA
jgi:hypothetical protein